MAAIAHAHQHDDLGQPGECPLPDTLCPYCGCCGHCTATSCPGCPCDDPEQACTCTWPPEESERQPGGEAS